MCGNVLKAAAALLTRKMDGRYILESNFVRALLIGAEKLEISKNNQTL
jgi:hypothetical protein